MSTIGADWLRKIIRAEKVYSIWMTKYLHRFFLKQSQGFFSESMKEMYAKAGKQPDTV